MERYNQRQIGKVCELTMEDILNNSLNDLIDNGKRFTIVNESKEEEDIEDGN